MKFLVDECTGAAIVQFLRNPGYDVVAVAEEMPQAEDEEILARAVAEDRILVTNDKGFGEKVFRERHPHRGVILLRLADERPANRVRVMRALLEGWGHLLSGNFTVVTERRVRIRRQPAHSSYHPLIAGETSPRD
jgi:predicted nuclease of predicted toxin-antitoxin system